MTTLQQLSKTAVCGTLTILLTACGGTMPKMGGGSGYTVTGAAAGSSSENKNEGLESCAEPIGTVRIFEDTSLSWWGRYRSIYPNLGTTVPVMRTMIQQSNCLVIVERGRAMDAMRQERALMNSGELRSNSNFGQGQMVAADYTLSPSVEFRESRLGRIGGFARGLANKLPGGGVVGAAAGSVSAKSNEASTTILMIDNRSGVQVSSSVGNAKNFDWGVRGYSWGSGGLLSGSGFTDTAEGKVIMAAFADSYNNMVIALRKYKPQRVKGGLGTGGALEVDGQTKAVPASKPAKKAVAKTETQNQQTAYVSTGNQNVTINKSSNKSVYLDDWDEDAMEDYYDALKGSVEHLGNFANMTKEQADALRNDSRYAALGGFGLNVIWGGPWVNKMETAQIELESWPAEAKQEAWNVYGKRIKKYNKIFERHKKTILTNQAFDQSVLDQLEAIELVDENNLFSE